MKRWDMDETRFTVFFEQPFWVGVFERIESGKLSVCKVAFGTEPKDGELWDFILKHYSKLNRSTHINAVRFRLLPFSCGIAFISRRHRLWMTASRKAPLQAVSGVFKYVRYG